MGPGPHQHCLEHVCGHSPPLQEGDSTYTHSRHAETSCFSDFFFFFLSGSKHLLSAVHHRGQMVRFMYYYNNVTDKETRNKVTCQSHISRAGLGTTSHHEGFLPPCHTLGRPGKLLHLLGPQFLNL